MLTKIKFDTILDLTRTTYFGSLTGDKEIESGEFTDELKIKGHIKSRERKNERYRKGLENEQSDEIRKGYY